MVRKVFNTAKVVMIARFRDELTMLEPLTEEQMKELTRNQMSEKFIFTTSSGKDIQKEIFIYLVILILKMKLI